MQISVSIPDELKAQMDEFRDEVNWSAVARKAFEDELGRLRVVRFWKDLHRLLAKERATPAAAEPVEYIRGRDWGSNWAGVTASPAQVQGIYGSVNAWSDKRVDSLWERLAHQGSPERFGEIAGSRADGGPISASDFYRVVLGEHVKTLQRSRAFMLGFVHGAIAGVIARTDAEIEAMQKRVGETWP